MTPIEHPVAKELTRAVTILYRLQMTLSNSFTGMPESKHDKALVDLRHRISDAVAPLCADRWLPAVANLIPAMPVPGVAGHSLATALIHLASGGRIRKPSWPRDQFTQLVGDELVASDSGITNDDFLFGDTWELLP